MTAPICDFCNGTAAAWALDCENLAVLATGTHGAAVAALVGSWNACPACLTYIQSGDPDGLADYVARAGHGPPELLRMTTEAFRRDVFRQLYARVLPQLGAPQPLREAVGVGGALRSVDGGNGG